MNLKYILKLALCLILTFAYASCNSDNEYTITDASSDAQIKSFSVSARPYTATDTLTYPALAKTFFTVQNKGGNEIFNVDSLPKGIDIKTLLVTLAYSSSPRKVELVYLNDSIVDWNTTDSVKFVYSEVEKIFYPKFKIIAPNDEWRQYTIDFRVHKYDPDAIEWNKAKAGTVDFNLLKQGETKVFKYKDGTEDKFRAYTKAGTTIYTYTSSIDNPKWEELNTITQLPSNTIIQSIQQSEQIFATIAEDGSAYTSTDGIVWEKKGVANIEALIGWLPEIDEASPQNEFLVIYKDDEGNLLYGKTADFDTIEDVNISTRKDGKVSSQEPVKNFTTVHHTLSNQQSIVVTGGESQSEEFLRKSFRITNLSLKTDASKAKISILPGNTAYPFPEKDAVSTFLYDEKIYALSADSLCLYKSDIGDTWANTSEKQNLDNAMISAGKASVVVDQYNYIWVFGGVSKASSTYSTDIWRGRMNKMIPKE